MIKCKKCANYNYPPYEYKEIDTVRHYNGIETKTTDKMGLCKYCGKVLEIHDLKVENQFNYNRKYLENFELQKETLKYQAINKLIDEEFGKIKEKLQLEQE